jgi:D-alanyl-D-alanine dipeptidase
MGYTGENILKTKFYHTNKCFVHPNLLQPLNNIQSELKEKGYQLCIIDAYRPLSVQKQIFNLISDTRYVSDPTKSRHPRGTAIDVTLCDLNGNKIKMPTEFSDFGEKCCAFPPCDKEAEMNRTLLQKRI